MGDDFSDEIPLDAIGFEDGKGTIRHTEGMMRWMICRLMDARSALLRGGLLREHPQLGIELDRVFLPDVPHHRENALGRKRFQPLLGTSYITLMSI